MQEQISFNRRILPLNTAQFFGTFNENAFRLIALLAVCGSLTNSILNGLWILLFTAVTLLPSLFFIAPAGFLSDRLPKRYTMLLTKILEIVILLFAVSALKNLETWGVVPLLTAMVLHSIQNVLFTPAVYGLLPETFHESELTRANGTFASTAMLAAVCGFGAVPLLHYGFNCSGTCILWVLILFSVFGFVSSAAVTRTTSVVQVHRELAYSFSAAWLGGFREIFRSRGILLSALGETFFLALGAALLVLMGFFAKYTLRNDLTAPDVAILRLAPVLGMIAGCYLAGRICRKKIDLGIVPFGAAGVAIFLLLGAYIPGEVSYFSFSIPNFWEATLKLYFSPLLYFFLAGLSGGLFLVPLRAFYQQRLRPEKRGSAIAAINSMTYGMLTLVNALVLLLAAGIAKHSPELPENLRGFVSHLPEISPQLLILLTGVITVAVTFITMWILPDFALRFLLITLGRLIYRIRATGVENIPERGAALLLSNHTSYIDAILISSCTSRRVRFLMQEEFFNKPVLRWIARLTGFIKVPSSGKIKRTRQMFELVQDALRKGDIVCVFPEGTPSRNGIVGRFSAGFERMLPPEQKVPVIPVNIGRIWGSLFSYYRGPLHFRKPKEMPYFATITIGQPMPEGITPFEVRQRITELAADDAQQLAPHEHPIHYLLAQNARKHPFQVVMRDAADGKSFTFFKTYLASILFSREIRKRTSSESTYVGVLMPNCTAGVLCIMGSLLADKVPCPLNFTTSQEILELSIRNAKMELVLTSRLFLAKVRLKPTPEMVFLEDIAKCVPMWKKLLTMAGIFLLPYKELLNMIAPLSHSDCYADAVLLFSSGSTGIPKGVRLSHHNIYSDIFAMEQAISLNHRKDSIFGNLPMFHSFGLTTSVILPFVLRTQAVVFVHSPLDANLIGEAIVKYKSTILVATPSFMQTYLRKFKPEVYDTLRLFICGAEKLRADIADRFREIVNGRLEIVEGYGCTETSPVVTINVAQNVMDTGTHYGKKGAIGLGLETICTQIMDPITFKPVPPETEGLLFVKGPNVMKGYLDDPKQTAQVLIDGYYNTGDIAKMDESGYVTICGRLSRFSKIAGEMVPHEMVECIINEMCGLEERVVAVGSIPDPQKGEALLVLYTPAMPGTPAEIVEQLRERSISNLWIPKATNFYPVDALPLLGSGKLDLSVLRKISDQVALERKAAEEAKA